MDTEAVIFDMDGVIFDSERTWRRYDAEADELFATRFPAEVSERFCGMDENTIRKTLKTLMPELDVVAYREYIISHVREHENSFGAPLKPGFERLISQLKAAGIKTAVASSSLRARAQDLFKKAELDINELFDAAVFCEDVTTAKPDPEIFLTAAKRMGASPRRTAVLEDSINGIMAAFAGGFLPIMVIDLIRPPESLLAPPYSLKTANSLADAAKLLGL